MAQTVQRLYPALLEADKTISAQQRQELINDINDLKQHLTALKPAFDKKSTTRWMNYQLLQDQLDSTLAALGSGRIVYAKNLLRSTTTLCMSCHTQDKQVRISKPGTLPSFQSDFARGEFLFITRQYPLALDAFKRHLEKRNSIKFDKQSIDALDRILVIDIQMMEQPDQAIAYLQELLEKDQLDKSLSLDAELWIQGLRELPAIKKQEHASFAGLKVLAEQYIFTHGDKTGPITISEERRPFYIWLRSQLYNYANTSATEEQMPMVLYWLAISDRVLEYRYFYSLADTYLKQCITSYTKHPYAKRCFNEYKRYIQFAYSGSGGTHIPDDVQNELDQLKSLLDSQ